MDRREILKILGLTAGATAAASCTPQPQGDTRYYPYQHEYDHIVYGKPSWVATTCRECPAGCGMLVKIIDGRPVKVEGNPDHPINRGGLCPLGQASLQGLYHPERFQGPMLKHDNGSLEKISWDDAEKRVVEYLKEKSKKGSLSKAAFISHSMGHSRIGAINMLLAYESIDPAAIHGHIDFAGDHNFLGGRLDIDYMTPWGYGFDKPLAVAFENADYLISINSDFLEAGPSRVEHMHRLSLAREKWGTGKTRFVHFGPRMSLTAANADRWIQARPGSETLIARALLHAVDNIKSGQGAGGSIWTGFGLGKEVKAQAGVELTVIEEVAHDLVIHSPSLVLSGVVQAGDEYTTSELVKRLNQRVGAINEILKYGADDFPGSFSELNDLCASMENGSLDALFLYNFDPRGMPLGDRFFKASKSVGLRVLFSTLRDGAFEAADLIMPTHHFLEDWDEYSPRPGTQGIVQPAIRPLYDTKNLGDLLLEISEKLGTVVVDPNAGSDQDTAAIEGVIQSKPKVKTTKFMDYMAGELRAKFNLDDAGWFEAKKRGGIFGEEKFETVEVKIEDAGQFDEPLSIRTAQRLAVFASPLLYDGRGENRPWLREIADPISKIAYDAWIEMSPDTAEVNGVKTGDLVTVETEVGSGKWAVRVTRGIMDGVYGIPISPRMEIDGKVVGDVMNIVKSGDDALSFTAEKVSIKPTGEKIQLAFVQNVEDQHGRGVARYDDYESEQHALEHWREENDRRHPPRTNMYNEHVYEGHKWGMVIDLDKCVGCNACVVACYAENNLPVVGRDLVIERREMAWIRIDRFYENTGGGLRAALAPVPCQHCDNAPCESVCPVFATLHTREGLNAQVYNRCIGTRFCSNNCPYKVRRFNWFSYEWKTPLQMQLNPEVTVREMGVMEKCSFCVQRIMAAKMNAKLEGREVVDGDVSPACAQSCPAGAIVFGDLNDPKSRVAKLSADKRLYTIFPELNTKPAVRYLTRIARKG